MKAENDYMSGRFFLAAFIVKISWNYQGEMCLGKLDRTPTEGLCAPF